MKKYYWIVALACTLILHGCMQEDENLVQTKSKITFALGGSGDAGRTSEIKDVSAIIVSLTDATGMEVLTRQKINVNSFGDGLISDPVELPVGQYMVTDFFLVNDESDVLYATPHKGSFLESLIKRPLGHSFGVVKNKTTVLPMEVIEVAGQSPEDFGYKSFSVKAVNFFPVSVHMIKNGKRVYTNAEGFLLDSQGDTVGSYILGPKINLIKFEGDVNAEYSFFVIKDGFAMYSKKFRFTELKQELMSKPLIVNLDPAFTLRLHSLHLGEWGEDRFDLEIHTAGIATLHIDWGDGIHQSVSPSEADELEPGVYVLYVGHQFAVTDRGFFVSITGDVDKVTGYTSNYSDYAINPLKVDVLTNLKLINMFLGGVDGLLDLRKNEQLEHINISSDSLLLPKKHALRSVWIMREGSDINYVTDNIYQNVLRTGLSFGRLDFSDYPYGSCDSCPAVGPLSPSSRNKLRTLRDTYHWTLYPSL